MNHRRSRLLCLLAAGVLCTGVAVAQQTAGAFKGRVLDKATGLPIADVQVNVLNLATGYVRSTTTVADGTFRMQAVPLGNYKITFKSKDAVASVTRTSILGQETEINMRIAPAASATVTVVATADTVDQANTTSAEVGVNISSERLLSLPVLSRNVVSAAVLAPGVQLIQGSTVDPTKKSSTYMSTGDGQGRGTNFNIDGGDNNSTDVGGYVSPIPMDAIGEFQVLTNQYKAEFGRSNAGFLNVVSKAGSNEFNGVLSGQFTNQSMRARKTDEGVKGTDSSHVWAAMVSGPIIKDKLFYMVAAEKKNEKSAPITFPGDAIAAYPALGGVQAELNETNIYARVDWGITPNVNATFTYGYDKNETPYQAFSQATAVFGRVDPSFLGTGLNKTTRYGAKVTTNITSNLVWESNLVYFDYKNSIRPNGDGDGVGDLQLRTRTSTLLNIDPSMLGAVGHDPNAYQNTGIKRTQWRNDVSYAMADHMFKAGLDYQDFTNADQINFYPETGLYRFFIAGVPFGQGLWSNTLQADVNIAGVALRAKGLQKGDQVKQYGFYAQDDWTVSPNFSVYLGVRLDKDTSLDFMKDYADLYQQISTANPNLLHGSGVPTNKTYFSPRLQLVYKPNGDDSTTFKFGYGKFVANVVDNVTGFSRSLGNRSNGITTAVIGNSAALAASGATNPGAIALASFKSGATLTTVNGHAVILPADLTPYNYVHNVNGIRDYFLNTVDPWLSTASFASKGKSLMASDFQYPTTDTINLGGTFKLTEHQTLDLQYVYSRTQHVSARLTTDGTDPRAWSPSSAGQTWDPVASPASDMNDNVFLSNQTSRTNQVQVKYSYTSPKFTSLVTFVAKEARSSYGGSNGAFDASGRTDFYGQGAVYPYVTNPERRSQGTESFSGSFSLTYVFDIGTHVGLLGAWHSGKFYDVYQGYNADVDVNGNPIYMGAATLAHPNPVTGQGSGDWNLDLGLRISQVFKFSKTVSFEPFLQISNLLNNYDYGAAYNNTVYTTKALPATTPFYAGTSIRPRVPVASSSFGTRVAGYQANLPRQAAVGFRLAF